MKYAQLKRDFLCLALLGTAVLWYKHNLFIYLNDLQNPLFLAIGFAGSLVIAALWELNGHSFRIGMVRVTGIVLTFALGVLVAHWVRDTYVVLTAELSHAPTEFVEFVGHDVLSAMSNRAVGYGACFAVGMIMMRWTVGQFFPRVLTRLFLLPENRQTVCEHCKQTIHP